MLSLAFHFFIDKPKASPYNIIILDYKHGITISSKSVLLFNGSFISLHHKVVSAKGRNHHQKSGQWQMKIGNHAVGNLKIIRRENEFIRPAFVWFHMTVGAYRTFEGSHNGGSHSANLLFLILTVVDDIGILSGDDDLL